jgi:hypothetical protein
LQFLVSLLRAEDRVRILEKHGQKEILSNYGGQGEGTGQ